MAGLDPAIHAMTLRPNCPTTPSIPLTTHDPRQGTPSPSRGRCGRSGSWDSLFSFPVGPYGPASVSCRLDMKPRGVWLLHYASRVGLKERRPAGRPPRMSFRPHPSLRLVSRRMPLAAHDRPAAAPLSPTGASGPPEGATRMPVPEEPRSALAPGPDNRVRSATTAARMAHAPFATP